MHISHAQIWQSSGLVRVAAIQRPQQLTFEISHLDARGRANYPHLHVAFS